MSLPSVPYPDHDVAAFLGKPKQTVLFEQILSLNKVGCIPDHFQITSTSLYSLQFYVTKVVWYNLTVLDWNCQPMA